MEIFKQKPIQKQIRRDLYKEIYIEKHMKRCIWSNKYGKTYNGNIKKDEFEMIIE